MNYHDTIKLYEINLAKNEKIIYNGSHIETIIT